MFSKLKKVFYWCIFYSGLVYVIRILYNKLHGNPIRILYTHRIIDKTDVMYPFMRELGYLTVEEFEKKLRFIKSHFQIITLAQALDYLKRKQRPANCLVLTFDDGYQCNYDKAYPVLKKLDVPATIFLSVDLVENDAVNWRDRLMKYVGRTKVDSLVIPVMGAQRLQFKTGKLKAEAFLKINCYLKTLPDDDIEPNLEHIRRLLKADDDECCDRLMLSWAEVQEMMGSGLVAFGAHTLTHPILTRISLDRAAHEISESKVALEAKLGQKVAWFAYPNGDFDLLTAQTVERCGYLAAFTTCPGGNGSNADSYTLKRDGFTREAVFMFGLTVTGFFDFIRMFFAAIKRLVGNWKEKN